MASESHIRANARYDRKHTISYHIKLNKNTDADIIKRLNRIDNKQGYIKALIREDINRELYDIDIRVDD